MQSSFDWNWDSRGGVRWGSLGRLSVAAMLLLNSRFFSGCSVVWLGVVDKDKEMNMRTTSPHSQTTFRSTRVILFYVFGTTCVAEE